MKAQEDGKYVNPKDASERIFMVEKNLAWIFVCDW